MCHNIHGDIMKSIWTQSIKLKSYKPLENDLEIDTIIIGGGLTGILTAKLLSESNIECAIIEAKEICSGQTKNTTAKITSQHGAIYSKIEKYYGIEFARQYASANQNAIEEYRRIIKQSNIKCNLESQTAYLYSTQDTYLLSSELESASNSGIDCFFEKNPNIPINTIGAIGFKNQAQFNPLKFIDGIIDGLTIYENTPALRIEGDTVFTPKAEIKAKRIVIACHYPFVNFPSFYFFRMSQERSYVLALENTGTKIDGMYIGAEPNSLSFRQYKDYLIFGGMGHRTGNPTEQNCFDALNIKAHKIYPNSKEISRWSAQDCITIDGLPYIGKFSNNNDNIYIATGYNKWGMTTSMVAARIITDMICESYNCNADVFSAQRFNYSASKKRICKNSIETLKGFSAHLKSNQSELNDIPPNTAKEIKYNGKKAGAYNEANKRYYIVSTVCPHLKCKLNWNATTKTWDCPCHGSRYNYKGELIDNPAQQSSILIAVENICTTSDSP